MFTSGFLPRQKVSLVVRSGKLCLKSKRIWRPKCDRVPVPVLSPRSTPLSMQSLTMSRYCSTPWYECESQFDHHSVSVCCDTDASMIGAGAASLELGPSKYGQSDSKGV